MSLSISAPEANGDLIRIRGQPQLGLGRLIKKRTSLPFEGAGGISTWKLDLPKKFPSFERFQHLRRTSSHPSCSWPGIAAETVEQAVADLFREVSNGANLGLLFSLPHDFPMEWSAFVNGASPFSVAINRDFFLYFTHGRDITLTGLHLYAADLSKRAVGDAAAGTTDLNNNGVFTLTAPADGVLVRNFAKEVFLIIQYTLTFLSIQNANTAFRRFLSK